MIRLQRLESGPYFTVFSLNIPDMRSFISMREIVNICLRSRRVEIEPVLRYRTPKPGRLLVYLQFFMHQSGTGITVQFPLCF